MRCASNFCCGASYAAPLHTLAEEYCGVPEPSLTLAKRVSRELLSAQSKVLHHRVKSLHGSHTKLLYTSPWPSGGVIC